ncbi:hypothetical protein ACFL4G_04620 [Thermodesulfobacteriota bacterium]
MSGKAHWITGMMIFIMATFLFSQCCEFHSGDGHQCPAMQGKADHKCPSMQGKAEHKCPSMQSAGKPAGCSESLIKAKTALMTDKLGLNDDQAAQLVGILHEIHVRTAQDRSQHKDDDVALLKAARERQALKVGKVESILDDTQKEKFREIIACNKVGDQALLAGERLGLDCDAIKKLGGLMAGVPTEEEAIAVKQSGDPEKISALREKTDGIHKQIESILTDEQKVVFRKMIEGKCPVAKILGEG